jgi:hypothetical protein
VQDWGSGSRLVKDNRSRDIPLAEARNEAARMIPQRCARIEQPRSTELFSNKHLTQLTSQQPSQILWNIGRKHLGIRLALCVVGLRLEPRERVCPFLGARNLLVVTVDLKDTDDLGFVIWKLRAQGQLNHLPSSHTCARCSERSSLAMLVTCLDSVCGRSQR